MDTLWHNLSACAGVATAIAYLFDFAGVTRYGVGYWSSDRRDH
jgi:hypothetical protein